MVHNAQIIGGFLLLLGIIFHTFCMPAECLRYWILSLSPHIHFHNAALTRPMLDPLLLSSNLPSSHVSHSVILCHHVLSRFPITVLCKHQNTPMPLNNPSPIALNIIFLPPQHLPLITHHVMFTLFIILVVPWGQLKMVRWARHQEKNLPWRASNLNRGQLPWVRKRNNTQAMVTKRWPTC